MKQHGMKQVSCDTDVGKIKTDYRVLDVRRPIFADLGREEDQVLPNPPSMQSMLALRACPTKAFSEYLVETIFAIVEALGHSAVMLHSDQEPVLVQLLKAVQSRRVQANTGETWPESQPPEPRQD